MDKGVVIVTGGGRGIGVAICFKLSEAGYPVAVNYSSDAASANKTADAIRQRGGRAETFAADVSDPAAVRMMFQQAVEALGPLAGLVNNAGIVGRAARVEDLEFDDLSRLFAVNVLGTMLCAKEAVRRMSTKRGGQGGSIVNLSSVAARLGGLAGIVPYAATKGAIETFTRGFAIEVAREGIRVNAVAPGMIATDMASEDMRQAALQGIPMGRIGQAEEIAEAVLWLMSPASSYATGSVITVSGGR